MSSVCQKIRTKARASLKAQQPQPVSTQAQKNSHVQSSRLAEPVQETLLEVANAQGHVIKQQQSLELVQIMLLISVCSI